MSIRSFQGNKFPPMWGAARILAGVQIQQELFSFLVRLRWRFFVQHWYSWNFSFSLLESLRYGPAVTYTLGFSSILFGYVRLRGRPGGNVCRTFHRHVSSHPFRLQYFIVSATLSDTHLGNSLLVTLYIAWFCPVQPPLHSHFAVVTCPSSGVSGFAIVVYITIPCGFILYETRYGVPLAPASAALAHVCFCRWVHTLRSSQFLLLGL